MLGVVSGSLYSWASPADEKLFPVSDSIFFMEFECFELILFIQGTFFWLKWGSDSNTI